MVHAMVGMPCSRIADLTSNGSTFAMDRDHASVW
jgi:hypothetical protein